MQLHLALNLLDARPVCPLLQLSERPASVHGLRVLAPVQEPQHFTAADARGGPARSLPCGRAHLSHEPLASPGKREEEEGDYSTERGEDSGDDGGGGGVGGGQQGEFGQR